ncbi:hypothetical protein PANDA_012205 [Ailuropoda melanoleuca]|uniref:Glycosyltransferase 2-like domain-containing protein n=1 Tax=Ailuropoda melanoleuca TaxID=9646 RepID=D2HL71_AILME|nr:hypothetical protein PANDA_012205 [Ailuropoda melanoleuca]
MEAGSIPVLLTSPHGERNVIDVVHLVSRMKHIRSSTTKPGAKVLKKFPVSLSKSLGLIEGYGGRGKGGLPATLSPAEEEKAKGPHEKYGYNSYLSEKISLDRSIPDYRPTKCKELKYAKELPQISIIFIFVNEALSVILRSVHSAVNHTPTHLLKEIILVDDNSDEEELKAPLEEYVHKRYPGLVKVVRNQKREGLIRARIEGWKVATGQVTGFFDAHVEFTAGWAEPVLSRIQENRKRVILPSIDNIKQDTFEVQRYENSAHGYSWELWCMYISPPKDWWDAGDPSLPIRPCDTGWADVQVWSLVIVTDPRAPARVWLYLSLGRMSAVRPLGSQHKASISLSRSRVDVSFCSDAPNASAVWLYLSLGRMSAVRPLGSQHKASISLSRSRVDVSFCSDAPNASAKGPCVPRCGFALSNPVFSAMGPFSMELESGKPLQLVCEDHKTHSPHPGLAVTCLLLLWSPSFVPDW